MPKPSVAVVQCEADDEHRRQIHLTVRGRLPDGEALGEVVQPDTEGDEKRQPVRRRQSGDESGTKLRGGRGTRPERAGPAGHAAVVVHEAEQPHTDAPGEHEGQPRKPGPGAVTTAGRGERVLDWFVRVLEHVEEQEQQDADGDRVERGACARHRPGQPPDRRPTKMVEPAIAPRINSFVVDMGTGPWSVGGRGPTIVRDT